MLPIRTKILLTLFVMVIVSIIAISMTMLRASRDDKTQYVTGVLGMTTASLLRELDALLEHRATVAMGLGYVNASRDLGEEARSRTAEALFATAPDLVAVTVIDAAGSPRTVVNGGDPLADALAQGTGLPEQPPAAAAADNGYPIRSLELVSVGDTRLLRMSLPVDAGQPAAGTLLVFMRADGIRALLAKVSMFRCQLMMAGNKVLLSNGAGQGSFAPELPVVPNTQLLVSNIEVNDETYLVGQAQSTMAPVALVTDTPKSVAALAEASLIDDLFLLGVVLFGAAVMTGIWLSRIITRRLESLSIVAKEVGSGRFDVPIEAGGKDEVGSLADALRSMTGGLRDRDEKLRVANAALVQSEKMAAIGQLSAGLAHEVKNPLAGILGFAQLSKRKIDDPAALRSNLDIIERETKRCSEIIGSLMQFARQERPERKPTEVNEAVKHALSIVDHQLSLKKVRIVQELAPALPLVLGNANQLEQALINLMINAQQAMQPDGGQVTVRTAFEQGQVLISVEDTGPGVPEEIRARIFEPFFTTKKVGQGTGLGLSVTYGLIKDHGGDITVGSGRTGGALFTISLPAQRDAPAGVAAGAATLQGSQAA